MMKGEGRQRGLCAASSFALHHSVFNIHDLTRQAKDYPFLP
jgi:hypothetical protein